MGVLVYRDLNFYQLELQAILFGQSAFTLPVTHEMRNDVVGKIAKYKNIPFRVIWYDKVSDVVESWVQ